MGVKQLETIPEKGHLALMTHLIAGYPSFKANDDMLDAMIDHQVDILEIQVPFSEPIADGPLFVQANQGAIEAGVRLDEVLAFMKKAAQRFPGPVLMMGYFNTVLALGLETFLDRLNDTGLSGFILPDLPPEQGRELFANARERDLAPILLVAPNTPDERLGELAGQARGMVYAVARKGVTGRHTELGSELADYLKRVRNAFTVPLGVGFGLSTGEDIGFLRDKVDIAIVGSALLKHYQKHKRSGVDRLLETFNQARGL